MALIEWIDSYSVGIENLDTQHKQLVGQMNLLYDAMNAGNAKEPLGEILDTLIQYTLTHFSSEEELFAQYGYPGAKEHIAEHEYFVGEVARFKGYHKDSRLLISYEVFAFLKTWIVEHMLGRDMKYRDFLLSKGVL